MSRRFRLFSWIFLTFVMAVLAWQLLELEKNLLYHPELGDPLRYSVDPFLSETLEEVSFQSSDGITIQGWYFSAKANQPTAVLAHGNAGSIADRQIVIKAFVQRGYGILAFDYRGYGKSGGTRKDLKEQGLYQDLEAASDYLRDEKNIAVVEQIAVGESLGGAVVIDVASRREFKAVVVYSTFTSLREMAIEMRNHWIIPLPLEWLNRQKYASIDKIGSIKCPLIMAHGDADTLVPLAINHRLFAEVRAPLKKHLIIKDAGHNDVFYEGSKEIMDTLDAFLKK